MKTIHKYYWGSKIYREPHYVNAYQHYNYYVDDNPTPFRSLKEAKDHVYNQLHKGHER